MSSASAHAYKGLIFIRLIAVKKNLPSMWAAQLAAWDEVWNCIKRGKSGGQDHCLPFSDCRCNLIKCLEFLLPCLPYSVAINKPFIPLIASLGYFITVPRYITKTTPPNMFYILSFSCFYLFEYTFM